MTCHACLVVDDQGDVLFARRADARLANASTTKMATALAVRETLDLSTRVEVSPNAASVGQGGFDLQPGEVYTVRSLLYALLLTSSNEAAVALAEGADGTEAAFVARLNALAGELGATDTHFVTAHGLDRPDHYSSARDLVTIAEELLADPLLARIVATAHAVIRAPGGEVVIDNRNLLLESYPGAIGVKTGFTNDAGNVLVAAASRQGRRVVTVAMRSEDAAVDSRRLLDFGFARLRRTVLVGPGIGVAALVFDSSGAVGVTADAPVRGLAPLDEIEATFAPDPDITAPVGPGEVVGTIVVTAGGRAFGTTDAVAIDAVERDSGSLVATILAALLRLIAALTGR